MNVQSLVVREHPLAKLQNSSAKVLRESRGSSAEEFCYFDGRSGLPTLCISATNIFVFSVFIFSNLNNPNKKLAIPSN